MPQIKSAQKRMRQEVKRAARNRGRKERLKKALKVFKTALAKPEAAALSIVSKAIDKAGAKGVLHRNAVNRRKSRAALAMNKALTAQPKS